MQKKIDFKKGSGEFLSFAVIAPMICIIFVIFCSLIQLFLSARQITDALIVSSRSVAVCTSMEDAELQAQLVAESAISSDNITFHVVVEYLEAGAEWRSGVQVKVTIYADVDTIHAISSGTITKSTLVTIE